MRQWHEVENESNRTAKPEMQLVNPVTATQRLQLREFQMTLTDRQHHLQILAAFILPPRWVCRCGWYHKYLPWTRTYSWCIVTNRSCFHRNMSWTWMGGWRFEGQAAVSKTPIYKSLHILRATNNSMTKRHTWERLQNKVTSFATCSFSLRLPVIFCRDSLVIFWWDILVTETFR